MKARVTQGSENHSQDSSAASVKQQTKGYQPAEAGQNLLPENAPAVQRLRTYQEMANNSPQLRQLKSYQAMADQHQPQVSQLAKNSVPSQSDTVQHNNKTGLPDHLKSGIENLSGYSMDDVKVHFNSEKPAQLQAHAFAQGTEIHVSSGQEKHLPHEAWHVVQQKQGRVQSTRQLKGKFNVNDDQNLEKEADIMGLKASTSSAPGKADLIKNKVSSDVLQPQLFVWKSEIPETKESLGKFPSEQGKEMEEAIYKMVESPEQIKVGSLVEIVTYARRKYGIYDIDLFLDDGTVTEEFVTQDHKNAISNYCKAKNMILSVRDTGKLSLDRLEQGAKPKPHSILEKSIKESSLEKAHPEAAKALKSRKEPEVPAMIEGVSLDELKGFVGHWDKTGKLLGLRVDKHDLSDEKKSKTEPATPHEIGIARLQEFLAPDRDNPYIPLARFNDYKAAFGSSWQQFLYTGDYDLHEVYIHNKALVEGSNEKARALTGINTQISNEQSQKPGNNIPIRSGAIKAERKNVVIGEGSSRRSVPADTLHAVEGSEYAMIQHGDQAGYITNQIHEGRLKIETANSKAQLVGAVAEETSGPLAWCVRGTWYVTTNKDEHSRMRAGLHLTATSGWLPEFQEALKNEQIGIMEHKKETPTKI